MSLTSISYKEANKIISIYSDILRNSLSLGHLEKFRFSSLKGYDIYDVDNSLKICSAFRVFKTSVYDIKSVEKLRTEASIDGGATMSFFGLFAPDNIVQQLKKLNPDDIYSRSEAYKIEGDILDSDLWDSFSKTESHESFLDYCLSIEKTDIDYWEKVYLRLGITWDERDEYDEIYFIILNKHLFFNEIKHAEDPSVTNQPNNEKFDQNKNKSFYSRHKSIFDNILLISFFTLGLFYPILRTITLYLFLIIGFVQLYFWLKEPIENKLNFALNIFYMILCLIGIYNTKLGTYVLCFMITFWLFDIIRNTIFGKRPKGNVPPTGRSL